MSRFRAERRVAGPDGREWEIYVSRSSPEPRRLRVEAVSWYPWRESHAWSTTPDHVGRVVDQVAAGLAGGEVARPLGADFLGSREMVAGTYRGLRRGEETGYRL